ncbi:MAG: hypothetical protein IKK08_03680 [Clostridia bacterium]|nr:hypothetical protein [Clostridia bacterium]
MAVVISGYTIQPDDRGHDWRISSNMSVASATKAKRSYLMKIYIRYPSEEGFTMTRYKEAVDRCKAVLGDLRKLHDRLRRADAGTGRIAFAKEVLDNRTGDDQGVIEVVPFVEGARKLDSLSDTPSRLMLLESLADAMVRIHSVNVRHGDLKLENALCVMHGSEPRAVMIDFDHSYMDGKVPHPDDVGGTDGYLPPEVVEYKSIEDDEDEELMAKLQSRITAKSDIFALGIMFYRILTAEKPPIINHAYQINLNHPAMQEQYINELIRAMTADDPDDRPDAGMVLQTLRDKAFVDNLPPFEDVWPEHEGYSYQTGAGRAVKRIRRAKQGDELCYAVTFDGYAPRIYTFSMMKVKGLLAGKGGAAAAGPAKPRTASVSGGEVIDGYRMLGQGLSPADQAMYTLNEENMTAAGYVQIWHCLEEATGKPMYALIKADKTRYVRSLRILVMQQLIRLR